MKARPQIDLLERKYRAAKTKAVAAAKVSSIAYRAWIEAASADRASRKMITNLEVGVRLAQLSTGVRLPCWFDAEQIAPGASARERGHIRVQGGRHSLDYVIEGFESEGGIGKVSYEDGCFRIDVACLDADRFRKTNRVVSGRIRSTYPYVRRPVFAEGCRVMAPMSHCGAPRLLGEVRA